MSANQIEKESKRDWSDSINSSLLEILKEIEKEDEYDRQISLRVCKQLELYWHGFQQIFWDESAHDWRIPTHDVLDQISSREETKYIYDYVVNIFKAHGLSIIAALSAEVPGVPISPMDADNPADVIAAQKAEALGKVIQKHNKSKLIFYQALFTLFTNHLVAAYNYFERDEKYGTVELPKYADVKQSDSFQCSGINDSGEKCDFVSEEELTICPNCSSPLDKIEGGIEQQEVGTEEVNKGMEKFAVYGSICVKVPAYAADQQACGYLIHYTDQHYAWIRNQDYPGLIRSEVGPSGSADDFERIIRMPSVGRAYTDTYLQSLLTMKRVWIRPWMYDTLDEDAAAELKKEYPKGVYFSVVDSNNGMIAEVYEEKLDDRWTLAKGDLSRTVHGDPLGKPLLPLQDLENFLMNLNVESIEHSIPVTWADPEIVNFENYSQQEVTPGVVYPAKTSLVGNKRMDDYFSQLKTSTLQKEAIDFGQIVESKGQFVVGAFPSIFGGPQTEGSKTLGEYQESRSYALQRLSIPYQLLFFWWADVNYKGIKDYIHNMISDEKHNIQIEQGKFSTTQFLMEEFANGRFNNLQAESSVDLPVSFSQKRGTIQQMIQLNSEMLNTFLFSPENRKIVLRYLGMDELSDLDVNQTMKQLVELDELLKGEPITDPETGEEHSSIPVEPEIDDGEIHLRVIKTYLSSSRGQEYKKLYPLGYKNALLHARDHQMLNLEMAAEEQQVKQPAKPNKETEQNNQEQPEEVETY